MPIPMPIRILIIEDNDDDAHLLVRNIKKAGFAPESMRVDTPEGLAEAMQQPWDIILSDYTMPKLGGRQALEMVRHYEPDIPFFYVSGTIGEGQAVEAMQSGAQDYFVKGDLKRLVPAIERELAEGARRREYRLAEERIHYLANYDSLTGLPNRILFTTLCEQYKREAQQAQSSLGLFYLDLDKFKNVNDQLGTKAGDSLLIELARRLCSVVCPGSVVARLSSDEFGIIVPGVADGKEAAQVADKILSVLKKPFSLLRYEWRISASLGGSLFPRDGEDNEDLQASAIMALHHAQKIPGNSYLPYTKTMRTLLQNKLRLNHALEHALEQHEFKLHYQPQVLTDNGRIIGAEVLIRWQHASEMVSPENFIPMTEESGLIVPIGNWVLREACMQARRWRDAGLAPIRLAVNFSAYQFRQRDLVKMVEDRLNEYQLPADLLEVEITETTLMQDVNAARSILADLRELGVLIALDDFGTGYSSLGYLKRFPVDVLKIDKAFVHDLPGDTDDVAIVYAIIAMADKLGIKVIAEGVETQEQLTFLKDAGCDMAQGYYIQPPTTAEDFLPVLQRGSF